jgi:hypothetical protein
MELGDAATDAQCDESGLVATVEKREVGMEADAERGDEATNIF